jgi:TonB family protein
LPAVKLKITPKPPSLNLPKSQDGPLILRIVVDEQGLPVNIRVARSIGHAWDEQGIAAVENWIFHPKVLNGRPVATEATGAITF